MLTPIAATEEEAVGQLFSDATFPSGEMFVKGEFQYFAPGVPIGPRQPTPGLVVGLIDSGTTSRHPQLSGLVLEERTFVDGPVHDEIGHGTWAMLVTFTDDPNARFGFYSAKVTRNGSDLHAKNVISAFDWLVSKGIRVINISLGFDRVTPDVERLCQRIRTEQSVLVAAAAGNLGPDVKVYPAHCGATNVIAVGEVKNNQPTQASGRGEVYAEPPKLQRRWSFLADRGMEKAKAGQLEEAKALFAESLAASENPVALTQLALIHAHESKWAEARPLIERAVQLDPNQPDLRQTAGAVLLMLGEADAAIARLEQALALAPQNKRALSNLTRAWLSKQDFQRALDTLERAIAIDPNDVSLRQLRSAFRSRLGTER